jgi:hypothetical protein
MRYFTLDEMIADTLENARSELNKVKNNWEKIINDLSQDKNRQISPSEGQRIRDFFYQEERRFHIYYDSAYDNHEFALEVDSFSNEFGAKLEIELLDGQRRYDNEIHRRKIETIKTWGAFLNDIKFNIVAFVIGILTMLGYYFIRC